MTSSNWNIFRVTSPLCGEFTGARWISRTKASDWELWWFFFICAWINDWVNNREAGDLRRHRGHYDVNEMLNCHPMAGFLCMTEKVLCRLKTTAPGLPDFAWSFDKSVHWFLKGGYRMDVHESLFLKCGISDSVKVPVRRFAPHSFLTGVAKRVKHERDIKYSTHPFLR